MHPQGCRLLLLLLRLRLLSLLLQPDRRDACEQPRAQCVWQLTKLAATRGSMHSPALATTWRPDSAAQTPSALVRCPEFCPWGSANVRSVCTSVCMYVCMYVCIAAASGVGGSGGTHFPKFSCWCLVGDVRFSTRCHACFVWSIMGLSQQDETEGCNGKEKTQRVIGCVSQCKVWVYLDACTKLRLIRHKPSNPKMQTSSSKTPFCSFEPPALFLPPSSASL